MKRLLILSMALAVSMGVYALPNGKPFVEIEGVIVEVQNDIVDLEADVDMLIGDVTTIEGQIAVLEDELDLLADDVETNADAIDVIEATLVTLNAALATKQNIVNGVCPNGEAMVSVNVGVNDGTIVCEPVGGSGSFDKVTAYYFAFGLASSAPHATVTCPSGYTSTGGGAGWVGGLENSYPDGLEGWVALGKHGSGNAFSVMTVGVVCIQ